MIDLDVKPKKLAFTPSKKKKQPKRTLIQGKPSHLLYLKDAI